jgi:hypothetical protein
VFLSLLLIQTHIQDALPLLYSQYATRYVAGQAVLARAQDRTPQLARFVRSLERDDRCGGWTLQELLALPLQHYGRVDTLLQVCFHLRKDLL